MAKLYTNILVLLIWSSCTLVQVRAQALNYRNLVDGTRQIRSCHPLFQNISDKILPYNTASTLALSDSSIWSSCANELGSISGSRLSEKTREKVFESAFKQILEKVETRIRSNSEKLHSNGALKSINNLSIH